MNAAPDQPRASAGPRASKLQAVTIGLLLFLIVSGLIVYVAPLPSNFTESQSWGWTTVQ